MVVPKITLLIGCFQILLIGITVGQPPGFATRWNSQTAPGFQLRPSINGFRTFVQPGFNNGFVGQSFPTGRQTFQRLPVITRQGAQGTRTWQSTQQRQTGSASRGVSGSKHRPIVLRHSTNSQQAFMPDRSQGPAYQIQPTAQHRTSVQRQPIRVQSQQRSSGSRSSAGIARVTQTRERTKSTSSKRMQPSSTKIQTGPQVTIQKPIQSLVSKPAIIATRKDVEVKSVSEMHTSDSSIKTIIDVKAAPLISVSKESLVGIPTIQESVATIGKLAQHVVPAIVESKTVHIAPVSTIEIVKSPHHGSILTGPQIVPHDSAPVESSLVHLTAAVSSSAHSASVATDVVHAAPVVSSPVKITPVVSGLLSSAAVSSGSVDIAPLVAHATPFVSSLAHATPVVSGLAQATPVVTGLAHATPVVSGLAHATPVVSGLAHATPAVLSLTKATPVVSGLAQLAPAAFHIASVVPSIIDSPQAAASSSLHDELVAAFVAALEGKLSEAAAVPAAAPVAHAQLPVQQTFGAQVYNPYNPYGYYQQMVPGLPAHLYPAYMQEMMFGDTQDPPDPTAATPDTTTAAPVIPTVPEVIVPAPEIVPPVVHVIKKKKVAPITKKKRVIKKKKVAKRKGAVTVAVPEPTTPTVTTPEIILVESTTEVVTIVPDVTTSLPTETPMTEKPMPRKKNKRPSKKIKLTVETLPKETIPKLAIETPTKDIISKLTVEPLNKDAISKLNAVSKAMNGLKGKLKPETRRLLLKGIRDIVSKSKVDFANLKTALTKQLSGLPAKVFPSEYTGPAHITDSPSPLAKVTLSPPPSKHILESTNEHRVVTEVEPIVVTKVEPIVVTKIEAKIELPETVNLDIVQKNPIKIQTESVPEKVKLDIVQTNPIEIKTKSVPEPVVVDIVKKNPVKIQSLVDTGSPSSTATLEAILKEIASQTNGRKTLPKELGHVNFAEIAKSLMPKGTDLATQLSDPKFINVLREIVTKLLSIKSSPVKKVA